MHRLQLSSSSGGGSSGGDDSSSGWQLAQIYSEQTPGRVNAVEFLPAVARDSSSSSGNGGLSTSGGNASAEEAASGGGSASRGSSGSLSGSSDRSSFLVAVQGTNYLRQLSLPSEATADAAGADSGGGDGPAAVREERRIK